MRQLPSDGAATHGDAEIATRRTSGYGNSNEWEDMAEFARIHAKCMVEGSLNQLQALSPERFRIWERILLNGSTIKP